MPYGLLRVLSNSNASASPSQFSAKFTNGSISSGTLELLAQAALLSPHVARRNILVKRI
jgi:hypothetical protein